MLTFHGQSQRFCDGVSRRQFLRVGALGVGGLTLADFLRAEAQGAGSDAPRAKSIINIYLGGGPSHMDMFDLKPKAPAEYRGEFNPIATNVPGVDICEHMPQLAKIAEKYAIIRSVDGVKDEHSPRQSDSGWSEQSLRPMGGRPGLGAVVSKLHGCVNGTAPTSIGLSGFSSVGFLSPVYRDYRPDGPGQENLRLQNSMNLSRLGDRMALRSGLDRLSRDMDRSGMMEAVDEFAQRAVTVITNGTLAAAMDVKREDPRVIDRYGFNDTSRNGSLGGNKNFLLARRLVEVGVRVVSLSWGGWDTHGENFKSLRQQLPALDIGLSALLEDLDARGMLQDTVVMMSGEFGRTPRINQTAGRDHWSPASSFFIAGGGLRGGQAIGTTNERGERPLDRPVHIQKIFASVYSKLGIDVRTTTITDPNGRPQYLVDQRELIEELV